MSVLISTTELSQLLRSDQPIRLLDVRWALGRTDGREEYEAGHIPTASYVDLDTELAGHGDPADGRHPLPDPESFQAAARGWGLSDGEPVVVYDAGPALAAARAWWLLRDAGLDDVRILDGGYAAWTASGEEVEVGPSNPVAGNVTLDPGQSPTVDIDAAAAFPETGILLDARAAERYRGEVEPIDPKAGHIPGAISAPTTDNVDASGRFLEAGALRERFAELGVREGQPVAVYCGSGVTAAHEIAALSIIGVQAALYPGSWSAWSNHPDRPVATGDTAPHSSQEVSS